jgi:hypothetical protein
LAGDKLARDPPLSAEQPGGKFPLRPTVAKVAELPLLFAAGLKLSVLGALAVPAATP